MTACSMRSSLYSCSRPQGTGLGYRGEKKSRCAPQSSLLTRRPHATLRAPPARAHARIHPLGHIPAYESPTYCGVCHVCIYCSTTCRRHAIFAQILTCNHTRCHSDRRLRIGPGHCARGMLPFDTYLMTVQNLGCRPYAVLEL